MTLNEIISRSGVDSWQELVSFSKKFHERIGIDNSRKLGAGSSDGFEMLIVNPKQVGRGEHDGESWSSQTQKVNLQELGRWLMENNVKHVVQASTGRCMSRFNYIMALGLLQGERI
jgi:hypothetical protein